MEVDIPLGWKSLNLERYDGTTDPDEHLDAFLTQANLHTNNGAILCHVFPTSLKGVTLTWYGGLSPRSIDNFNTLVECFSSQYTTNRSHCMTSTTLVSLRLVYDESLGKFMDKFGRIGVHTQNLNQEVALHSMLHALWPTKFADNQCKRPHSSMDELCERAKWYIQMEEMSRFRNEVWQVEQKHKKKEWGTKIDSHKSDKRHKPDKRQPFPKGPRYERYMPLMANHTTILEEAFNVEVPIKLPPTLPPKPGLDKTKYYKYHHSYDHNTEDCWGLKEKIEELIQAALLACWNKWPRNN